MSLIIYAGIIKKFTKGRRGFTLVNSNLARSKERTFNTDVALVQSAIDAYFTSPSNVTHLGLRQYPLIGFSSSGTLNTWVPADASAALAKPLNPFRGSKGGEAKWRDASPSDGLRTGGEENLNAEKESINGSSSGWYVVKKNLEGVDYTADSRDYFIDFTLLVAAGLLKKVPVSVSTDNPGGSDTGSYSWYVDSDGVVNALLVFFPTNGVADGGTNNGPDKRGFLEGIYP